MADMNYNAYTYIEPPRAETTVRPALIGVYESLKWFAQFKKNGTNSVIFVPPKGQKPFAKTRHPKDPDHKVWQFSDDSIASFETVQRLTPGNGWSVFNAELLHSKGNGIRDTNYVHDVLVYDGVYLVGKTYTERYRMLIKIFGNPPSFSGDPISHHIVDARTWIAKNHHHGFKGLFAGCGKEDEGLVFKDPQGVLSARDNSGWLAKCRHPHKNFPN